VQKNHPKNMCGDCGFMSEHMYVIRRHMQRHSMAGCECHICGRRYKVSTALPSAVVFISSSAS